LRPSNALFFVVDMDVVEGGFRGAVWGSFGGGWDYRMERYVISMGVVNISSTVGDGEWAMTMISTFGSPTPGCAARTRF
jgi:hypothetical protein